MKEERRTVEKQGQSYDEKNGFKSVLCGRGQKSDFNLFVSEMWSC